MKALPILEENFLKIEIKFPTVCQPTRKPQPISRDCMTGRTDRSSFPALFIVAPEHTTNPHAMCPGDKQQWRV